ncbi:hypothetical protein SEPCBS119000_006477 [Sporothrix epigloea]|uniref:Uncharacterized protein n=1 Tax=Sporothrix epigloea TaxID=1892477 RepID=A0ABP0E558_9PEZI
MATWCKKQFGSDARQRIYTHLQSRFSDDEDFSTDSDDSVDQSSSSNDHGSENLSGSDVDLWETDSEQAMNLENNSNENDNTDEGSAQIESSVPSPELVNTPSPVPPDSVQVTTSEYNTIPANLETILQDTAASDSNGNAAQNMSAPTSETGAERPIAIPRAARARLNLTALSQRHNLYFAAYQCEIHVFRPQPAPEILKGPLLILNPSASAAAHQIGGYIDIAIPHQVNHLIAGDLGGAEILLLAYDDGDIIAYYTRHIVDYLECSRKKGRSSHPSPRVPKPFFCETLGATAWGLAIHSQSRLIAASSNHGEVNVFALALQQSTNHLDSDLEDDEQYVVVYDKDVPPKRCAFSEAHFRSRVRHYRVLLSPGPSSSNIPCINFINNSDGFAEKVAAIDIHGSVYILDIWKIGGHPIRIRPYEDEGPMSNFGLGWGVMIIPTEMFLPTAEMPAIADMRMLDRSHIPNIDGMLYFPHINESALMRQRQFISADDMTEVGLDLQNDPTFVDGRFAAYDSDEIDSSESGFLESTSDADEEDFGDESVVGDAEVVEDQKSSSTDGTSNAYYPTNTSSHWVNDSGQVSKSISPSNDSEEETQPFFHLETTICPGARRLWRTLPMSMLLPVLGDATVRKNDIGVADLASYFSTPLIDKFKQWSKHFKILRTFTNSVEILEFNRHSSPFYIKRLMNPPSRTSSSVWDMTPSFHRCSLLHMIPEINLIIVGNMFGRVVLIRPLRNSRPRSTPGSHVWALRVEWSLPFARDEQEGIRPSCCLLGMAVSPIPVAGSGRFGLASNKNSGRSERPRRFRLILHYMDHTVLQYYIEGSATGCDRVDVTEM